ncbi:Demethylmenaquinone methyltransferase [Aquisphaera giovannonii]|uniref:Demethylmenaquinone methyltransferase n=1 Tax=Aquisphaera giovannonii TaxID=406548 RepID=A0A5B9W653_9BACT|nr:methyltransferase domain-containing protein [Aquisphaera giovannonii]QEH35704.1 Demethylmenaquinone methyltransferase [Aquisphaera giovannonii]
MSDDLASGFRDVDRAADFEVFSRCLELVDSIPFFADCKRESYRLLGAGPGRRILDVGCGLGDDAAAMARIVAPGGAVVGVDASRGMVEAARRRHEDVAGLSFEVADAGSLPFDDASFDACRIDRVLQHVPDPAPAIAEMARVLRPGGVLVAYDNDWETLTVDAPDRALTRTVLNAWCDRFPTGWIGRRLVPLFLDAGLIDVEAAPRTLVLRDLAVADRLYAFFATADRLAESGLARRDDLERWAGGLRAADARGRFFCSYTGFLIRGVREARA